MNITGWLVKMQETHRWHDHPIFGIENEARFYLLDKLRDVYQTLDLVEFEYGCQSNVSRWV